MVFQAEKSDTLAVRLEEEKGLRRKEQEETREEKLRSGEEYKSLCQRLGQEMEDTRKVRVQKTCSRIVPTQPFRP